MFPWHEQYEKSKELVWPVGQSMQEGAVDELYCPVPQLTQADIKVDPVFSLYLPAPHARQLAAAVVSPYFPASHGVQDEALVAVVDELYCPVPQLTQADIKVDPVFSLYLPAPQAVQADFDPDTSSLYLPAEHSSQAVPAPFDTLPAGQLKQVTDWGQKYALLAFAAADAKVVPVEFVTLHEFSSG
jgi:hypothetical protein